MNPRKAQAIRATSPLALPQGPGIAGIDEAGLGPWAGPVVAAAVIIDPSFAPSLLHLGINDSKKLTAKRRSEIFDALQGEKNDSYTPQMGLDFAIGMASAQEIDQVNIRKATHLAMGRAIAGLTLPPVGVLVDGNHGPTTIACPMETIIKGDQKVLSIALASILAKVYRDRLMQELDHAHPFYGWASNAGYGTKAHQEALRVYGVTVHHRKSYGPIRAILNATDLAA